MEQQEYYRTIPDSETSKEAFDQEKLTIKLQSLARFIEGKQPKVFFGSSYYNEISDFAKQQGKLTIAYEGVNKDGTIKYSLSSWSKVTRFDYDPESKEYYIMPAGQPDKKIVLRTGSQVITAAERLNFCKYNNTADSNNNVAPYESNGNEIRKGTNYLISSRDFILPDTTKKKEYMDLYVHYLNARKTTNEKIK